LSWWFHQHREWQLYILPEMRIRVSANRVRIADLCLMSRSQPVERVLTKPPLAIFEVMSPEDRISRYNERLLDYRRLGVANVWVIDPMRKAGFDCSTSAWLSVEEFRIADSPVFLRLADMWAELEASQS